MWIARHIAVLVVVLILVASAQVVFSSRHLDKVPEELLREAIALDILASWSSKCLGVGISELHTMDDLHEYLEYLENILYGNSTAVIALGGVHVRALMLLLYGSSEITPEIVERLIRVSVLNLIETSRVGYEDIEELFHNPSLASLVRIYKRVGNDPLIGRCLNDVLIKLLGFGVYLERGDVAKARAVAEEVLSERSVFFGVLMLSIIEGRTYVVGSSKPLKISEEDLERLVSKLREMNVDLDEVLSKYSLTELIEIYESLKAVDKIDLQLNTNASLVGVGWGVEDVDDVLRQGAVSTQVSRENQESIPGGYAVPDPGKIGELVNRIPPKVIASAVSVVSTLSYSRTYAPTSGKTPPTYLELRRQGSSLSSTELLGLIFVAIAAMVVIPIVLRGTLRKEISEPLVRPLLVRTLPTTPELSAVIRVFWEVVTNLSIKVKVEVRPSDTHREIAEKLDPELDSVSSALLRRLSKLYEVARFSREVPEERLSRDLSIVKEMLGRVTRG